MNRLKELMPGILLTSLVIGISLFSIHSFSFDKAPNTSNINKALSVGQVSKSITEAEATEQRELFMAASDNQYTTSRGEYDRLAEAEPVAPAVSAAPAAPAAAKKPAVQAPKPAAPAVKPAPTKPKAAPAAKPASNYNHEVDLLARLIMAEAQGEPYEAKVAVGAVVINRVQSGQWAGSIEGVIYQKSGGYYQFTPVQNGWINKPADSECVKAAKAAISGADPTNGAQFYYDNKVTNEWILAKPVSTQIGRMIYAY